jgi:hypothetical protein
MNSKGSRKVRKSESPEGSLKSEVGSLKKKKTIPLPIAIGTTFRLPN